MTDDTAEPARPSPRRLRSITASAIAAAGVLIALGSWLPRDADPWWSSTLGNIAVAVLLLVPAEFAISWVRTGFRRVERETIAVRETAQAAKDVADQAVQSLADVREKLFARQRAEHEATLDIYRAIVTKPTRETIARALRTATEAGLISGAGIRMPVWETNLHYRYIVDGPASPVEVRLERDDTTVLSTNSWEDADDAETFALKLVEAVRAAGADVGLELNDPG